MFSRTVWVSLLLITSQLWVLLKLFFSVVLLTALLCHPANTLEVHRIFQVATTVLQEESREDTHSKLKLRTQSNATVPLMLRSKMDVVLCLVSSVLCAIPSLILATTTFSTLLPTTKNAFDCI